MFFYVSKIVAALIWPSSVITLMLVAGAALLLTGRAVALGPAPARVAGLALLLVCGFGPLGNWLVLPLEQRFARGPLPADVAGVIMLGGFETGAIGKARGELSINEAGERLTEGILVALRLPASAR